MINIQNPCDKDVFSMPGCGKSYHCSFCKKSVTDLRHKSTAEVEKFTTENKNACVIVHHRHENASAGRFTWLNRLENSLVKSGWKKTAVASVMIVLFLASCASRRKPHKVGKFAVTQKEMPQK